MTDQAAPGDNPFARFYAEWDAAQFAAMHEPDPADYADQPDTCWAEPESNLSIDLSDTEKARAYAAAARACKTATARTRYRRMASQHRHQAARRVRNSKPLESRVRRIPRTRERRSPHSRRRSASRAGPDGSGSDEPGEAGQSLGRGAREPAGRA